MPPGSGRATLPDDVPPEVGGVLSPFLDALLRRGGGHEPRCGAPELKLVALVFADEEPLFHHRAARLPTGSVDLLPERVRAVHVGPLDRHPQILDAVAV